jgi:hypothetical protein
MVVRAVGAAAVVLSVAVGAAPPASADPKPGDPCMNTEADSVTSDGKLVCAQDGSKFIWLNAHMKGAAGDPCDDEGAKVFGFGYPLPIVTCTQIGSGLIWK